MRLPLLLLLCCGLTGTSSGAQSDLPLGAVAVYQGGQASDAFSAIHHAGNGRVIAGKRSSTASNRFLLSVDGGASWAAVGCPASTGAHTYFFGQDGSTILAGTGDTGQACVMRSVDAGGTWSVVLDAPQLNALAGSANTRAVFGIASLGGGKWMANLKTLDTAVKVIRSSDDGVTWWVPQAQPGQGSTSWARQMILTGDGVLLWPAVLSERMYRSTDLGASWSWSAVPSAGLFQPLCDAGDGVYLCGEVTTSPNTPIRLFRSPDRGLTWTAVAKVNLARPTTTYWRDVLNAGGVLYASACCVEGTSNDRNMQLFRSEDSGKSWRSMGNPYLGPFGGMQAVYQMCVTDTGKVLAGCQPDSTILAWPAR